MPDSSKLPAIPFLRWAGSKRKLLPRLVGYWSGSHQRYVEPFMGSAALFFSLAPKTAILSDINAELVHTMRTVGAHPRAVHNRVSRIPRARRTYNALRSLDPSTLQPLDRAARFIYLNRNCFNGLYRTNSHGVFNVPFSDAKTGALPEWPVFASAAKSIQRARIIHCDFESTVNDFVRKGDFVYMDPPYALENRRVFRQYDPCTFGLADLERLAKCLDTIDARGAHFLLSYAACPEARKAFGGWLMRQVYTVRNISGFAEHRRRAAELLFTNIV